MIKISEQYIRAVETRKILFSGPIPICYMIDSLLINNNLDPSYITKITENKSEIINKIINSFDIKKKYEITMDSPDLYIKNKLLLSDNSPILSFTITYYTKSDFPVAKTIYYVSGENVELNGESYSV